MKPLFDRLLKEYLRPKRNNARRLAILAGVSPSTITRYVNGTTRFMSAETMEKIWRVVR